MNECEHGINPARCADCAYEGAIPDVTAPEPVGLPYRARIARRCGGCGMWIQRDETGHLMSDGTHRHAECAYLGDEE